MFSDYTDASDRGYVVERDVTSHADADSVIVP